MKNSILICLLIIISIRINSQSGIDANCTQLFDLQDTFRGSNTPERAWWDLIFYHLSVDVNLKNRSLSGSNVIRYKVLNENNLMQIDLQKGLQITSVIQDGDVLTFRRLGNVYYISINKVQQPGEINEIRVEFEGVPKVALRPPWEGGVVWQKDISGKPFVATACQGIGASVWWPNKDQTFDEPDSMMISIKVPSDLVAVSNGRLRTKVANKNGTTTFNWFVQNPINNYAVNMNIGDYIHFSDVFQGEKGALDCDYYVLRGNYDKAREHFKQVSLMLKAYEYWFGPYPFYEDGYKLVEVPYLGMEHQSSVTYGNGFENGYLGSDLSGTGHGLKFDFIIIHESGHEWFGNSITSNDIADLWVHEAFTTLSEGLYLEFYYGKKVASEYLTGLQNLIQHDQLMIGKYGVNNDPSSDIYFKGANVLNTLRQIINDDVKWRFLLRELNTKFYHSTVSGNEIEEFLGEFTGMNLKPFFDQYLRNLKTPGLEYYLTDDEFVYRWINVVPDFNMPLKILVNGEEKWINPKLDWTHEQIYSVVKSIKIEPNFYVSLINVVNNPLLAEGLNVLQ